MDVMVRLNAIAPKSGAGVAAYVGVHLQVSSELGSLAQVPGYLSRRGEVKPFVSHPDLWKAVGWDPGLQELPPAKLITALTQGFDLTGNRLQAGRVLYRAPKEAVITLPSELSEALSHLPPETGLTLLQKAVDAYLQDLEAQAVRIQVARQRTFCPAKTLSLAYIHQENRDGEAHWHAHVLTFPPALGEDGTWRTFENARQVARLSVPGGGRTQITSALLQEADHQGIHLELVRGLARERPRQPQGATVTLPDGRCFGAGTVFRRRRTEILAAQELRRELGAPPLTPRELERLRKETGKLPKDLTRVRRRDLLAHKLQTLGLLDRDGRILSSEAFARALQTVEQTMARAEVQLEASQALPGPQLPAAQAVARQRRDLARELAVDPAPSRAAARLRWTQDYARVLRQVAEAPPEGLATQGLDKPTCNLLSKLKTAGLLRMEKVHGRARYTPTPEGLARMGGLHHGRGALVAPGPTPLPAAHRAAPGNGWIHETGPGGAPGTGTQSPPEPRPGGSRPAGPPNPLLRAKGTSSGPLGSGSRPRMAPLRYPAPGIPGLAAQIPPAPADGTRHPRPALAPAQAGALAADRGWGVGAEPLHPALQRRRDPDLPRGRHPYPPTPDPPRGGGIGSPGRLPRAGGTLPRAGAPGLDRGPHLSAGPGTAPGLAPANPRARGRHADHGSHLPPPNLLGGRPGEKLPRARHPQGAGRTLRDPQGPAPGWDLPRLPPGPGMAPARGLQAALPRHPFGSLWKSPLATHPLALTCAETLGWPRIGTPKPVISPPSSSPDSSVWIPPYTSWVSDTYQSRTPGLTPAFSPPSPRLDRGIRR